MRISDRIVGIVSTEAMLKRVANRAKADVIDTAARSARGGRRGYDGARHTRFTRDWRATGGNADAELSPDLSVLRNRSEDLARNNPYIASAVRQLVANLVGDGIEARAQHSDPRIRALAQKLYLEWARSKVDGRHDFYGVQRLAVRTMVVRGDGCLVWEPVGGIPDARVTLLEGDQLASPQMGLINRTPRIQDGVEYDAGGQRAAYHFLEDHPGALGFGLLRRTRRVEAAHVDHFGDPSRPQQTRFAPWLCPSISKVRELQELADSIRTKKRLQSCIGIIRTLSADDADEPDTGTEAAEGDEDIGSGSPALERMVPGMVVEGLPGETFTTVAPTADGDSDVFYRQELRSVAASIGLPDHLMTGDVSQANYSSLRAATVAFWTLLDDWQANVIVPFILDPAFSRLMRRKALELREPKLAEVTAIWTPPPRFWVDPIKDVASLVMEERAGYINKPEALARRGIDWIEHFDERQQVQIEGDRRGLVFDTDPRRINGAGALQPPAGFVLPKSEEGARAISSFFGRLIDAVSNGDQATVNAAFIEAATELRTGAVTGQAKAAIVAALTGADEHENRV